MAFTIVADSCCDLSPTQCTAGSLRRVPLTIHIGGRSFIDNDTLRREELLAVMQESTEAPHTSCPSPADYLDVFEAVEGDIYVVTLSALLSGSHNSARQAAAIFLEEHLLALKLNELASSGLLFSEVVRQADRSILEMNTLFILENLDNLRKNGRLTKVQAALTGALHIKLLMGATPEGEICKRGQALSMKQGLSKLIQLMCADQTHYGKTLCIAHCNCRARAEELRMQALKHCDFQKVLICPTHGISTVYANDGGIICAY